MNTGLIAIFILLVIIVGAIATRRCVEFLIGGSLVAAIFMYRKDFLPQWSSIHFFLPFPSVNQKEAYPFNGYAPLHQQTFS